MVSLLPQSLCSAKLHLCHFSKDKEVTVSPPIPARNAGPSLSFHFPHVPVATSRVNSFISMSNEKTKAHFMGKQWSETEVPISENKIKKIKKI